MRRRTLALSDEDPPALDACDEPRSFDGGGDEQDPDAREQDRQPGRDQGEDQAEGDRRDEETEDDRAVRVPRRGMDRGEQERSER
jgi:hypothetical protein